MAVKGQTAFRIWVPGAIEALAKIYKTTAEAISQPVENSADAGATLIWVILEENRIVIIDNGRGMVPFMLQKDKDLVDQTFQLAEQGKAVEDPREKMSRTSLCSLEWMVGCVALSSKATFTGNVKGAMGLGSIAWRQYANKCTVFTKADDSLLKEYTEAYGKDALKAWAFSLRYPPVNPPGSNCQISEVDIPLLDPLGKPLDSGTIVEISEFLGNEGENIRPRLLESVFKDKFAGDLRGRRFDLYIIDRVTSEGRASRGGKQIIVQPAAYRGIPIIEDDEVLRMPSGKMFRGEIFYLPEGKGKISIRRHGGKACDLTDLPQFQCLPWTLENLEGFFDFPEYPGRENKMWDSSKSKPAATPEMAEWISILKKLEPRIITKVKEAEERNRNKDRYNLAKDLSSAAMEAISQISVFQDRRISTVTPPRGKQPSSPKAAPAEVVNATVFDENNLGVEGMTIELYQKNQLVATKHTGVSGSISFGKMRKGKDYLIKMVLPLGVASAWNTEYEFDITEKEPGFRAIFRVITSREKPVQKKVNCIQVSFTQFDDPRLPYVQKLHLNGIIDINELGEGLQEVELTKDETRRNTLLALYMTNALMEYALEGADPALVLREASLAFPTILQAFTRVRSNRARKVKTARKK